MNAELPPLDLPQVQPPDEHNARMVENVHPPDWANPEPSGRYNMVVVGGGTAGLVTAAGAAGLGAKVALVERDLLGGDCLVTGCVPSKALIRSARAAAEARGAGRFGVRVEGEVTVDFPAVMERMRRLRAGISRHDAAARFRELGVDIFLGEGRFTGPDTLEVRGRTLHFARACIATGARAAAPPIEGLEEAGYLTNETLFSLTELPPRLAVIGAGPIGSEMAQSFARFGSEVTLIEKSGGILPREDEDASRRLQAALERDGVRLITRAGLQSVAKGPGGKLLRLETEDGGVVEVSADEILVGVGRAPNVEGMGLEAAGVAFDPRRGVRVDDRLRTTNPRIYAAGDVALPFKFTHTADATARIVLRNALFFGRARASSLNIPWCTYTDPEIAHVGLYEREAREKGIEVETFRVELADVDRAVLEGEDEGFLEVHTRKGSGKILGATMVAAHAGEIISEISTAMAAGMGLGGLADVIHPYPTVAEAVRKAGDAYNRTRLRPGIKRLFGSFLRWRR